MFQASIFRVTNEDGDIAPVLDFMAADEESARQWYHRISSTVVYKTVLRLFPMESADLPSGKTVYVVSDKYI